MPYDPLTETDEFTTQVKIPRAKGAVSIASIREYAQPLTNRTRNLKNRIDNGVDRIKRLTISQAQTSTLTVGAAVEIVGATGASYGLYLLEDTSAFQGIPLAYPWYINVTGTTRYWRHVASHPVGLGTPSLDATEKVVQTPSSGIRRHILVGPITFTDVPIAPGRSFSTICPALKSGDRVRLRGGAATQSVATNIYITVDFIDTASQAPIAALVNHRPTINSFTLASKAETMFCGEYTTTTPYNDATTAMRVNIYSTVSAHNAPVEFFDVEMLVKEA